MRKWGTLGKKSKQDFNNALKYSLKRKSREIKTRFQLEVIFIIFWRRFGHQRHCYTIITWKVTDDLRSSCLTTLNITFIHKAIDLFVSHLTTICIIINRYWNNMTHHYQAWNKMHLFEVLTVNLFPLQEIKQIRKLRNPQYSFNTQKGSPLIPNNFTECTFHLSSPMQIVMKTTKLHSQTLKKCKTLLLLKQHQAQ